MKGKAIANILYPIAAKAKLLLMRHLIQSPPVVRHIPITILDLRPHLSRAATEGKFIGT